MIQCAQFQENLFLWGKLVDCLENQTTVEATFSLNFRVSASASPNDFQFELLLIFSSIMLRDSHFGLKFPTLDLSPRDYFFFWKIMNSFLLRKLFRGPFFFFLMLR